MTDKFREKVKNCLTSLIAQLVKNLPAVQETRYNFWVGKICWRRERQPTPVFLGFLCGSAGKESTCNVGDLGLTPGLGRSPGEWKGYPLQYSGLENSMDCIVHGVAKSQTQLSNVHFQSPTYSISWSPNVFWKRTVSQRFIGFSSVQFSPSVLSDSLRPHELQHARPPCPSPTPGVHSDSRP